jgi:hypothetical protein
VIIITLSLRLSRSLGKVTPHNIIIDDGIRNFGRKTRRKFLLVPEKKRGPTGHIYAEVRTFNSAAATIQNTRSLVPADDVHFFHHNSTATL